MLRRLVCTVGALIGAVTIMFGLLFGGLLVMYWWRQPSTPQHANLTLPTLPLMADFPDIASCHQNAETRAQGFAKGKMPAVVRCTVKGDGDS